MEFPINPGLTHKAVTCSARENLEINLDMRVRSNDMNRGPRSQVFEGLPAAHKGFGTQQPAGVDQSVRPIETVRIA
jgi:hypothetical protein